MWWWHCQPEPTAGSRLAVVSLSNTASMLALASSIPITAATLAFFSSTSPTPTLLVSFLFYLCFFSSYFLSYIRAFLYYIFILYQSKLEIGWRSWFASASRRQTWRRWRRSTRRHAAPTVMAPPVLTDRKLAFSWIHLTCDSRQCLRSLSFWFVHSFFLSLDNSDFHYVLDLSQCLPFAFFLSYVYIAGPRITKPLLNDTHLSDIAVTFILMFWCFYFTR